MHEVSYDNQLHEILYQWIGKGIVETLNPKKAEHFISKGYMMNPNVYTVINTILREIKQIKWEVYEVVDEKSYQQSNLLTKDMRIREASFMKEKSLEPLEPTNDPTDPVNLLLRLLKNPNECQSFPELMEEFFGFYYSVGNAFNYGLKPFENGLVTKIYNTPAQFTRIVSNGWMEPINSYVIDWSQSNQQRIPACDVYHYKKFNPNYTEHGDQLYGMSPLMPLSKVVMRSNESYSAGLGILQNGMPAGILSNDGQRAMTSQEIKSQEELIKKKFGGGKNKGKILGTSAPLKWQQMGINVGDMQLLDMNDADMKDIARAYGLPLPLITTDASTFNNVDAAKKFFWQNTIIPDIEGFKMGFGEWLLKPYMQLTGKKLVLEYEIKHIPALQDDLNKLSERLLKEMEQGIWTPRQYRNLIGAPILDEENPDHFDNYQVRNNLTILDNGEEIQGE